MKRAMVQLIDKHLQELFGQYREHFSIVVRIDYELVQEQLYHQNLQLKVYR